ncbi:MAG: HD domain-containing protein [Nocardioidaceae bacterium]
MEDLREHWPLVGHEALRDQLLETYGAPGRGYHDTRHLAEVLHRLDELLDEDDDRDAVLLAAWFHDAVYDGSADDEERSARLAEAELAGLDQGLADEVARLVRLTIGHRPRPGDRSGEVLCDADLAILAAPDQRYADYVAGVRREHAHVSEQDFARGRAAVLRALLAKPTLFHTEAARARWEEAARGNVARELAGLEG